MQKFTKKASDLVVEAVKVGEGDINEQANWAHAYVVQEKDALTGDPLEALNVRTSEGMERASRGMYVIKVGGKTFVSHPGSFESNFEAIQEEKPEEDWEIIGEMPDTGIYIFGDPRPGPRQI